MSEKISIIGPVLNDAAHLSQLLEIIRRADGAQDLLEEVLVVDGGSTDHSAKVVRDFGFTLINSPKGRAVQMNVGARRASGDALHFIHADSRPPYSFLADVRERLDQGARLGCFRSLFDTQSWMLKACSYFTRFQGMLFRGGGQTLWIERKLFGELEGYDEQMALMEEYDLIQRASKKTSFHIIPKNVLVSDRDYERYGSWRLQSLYGIVYLLYFSGASQETIKKFVYETIKKRPA